MIKVKWKVTETFVAEIDLDDYEDYDVSRDDFKRGYPEGSADAILAELELSEDVDDVEDREILSVLRMHRNAR